MILALDNGALRALVGPDSRQKRTVREALQAASDSGRDIVIPTVDLAESYRSAARTQAVDAFLARNHPAVGTRDTDRELARFVGAVLHASGAGSADTVDAHVVAVTAEAGGGLILSGDPTDLQRLAAPYRTTVVEALD